MLTPFDGYADHVPQIPSTCLITGSATVIYCRASWLASQTVRTRLYLTRV
jgi:hypothetical protein